MVDGILWEHLDDFVDADVDDQRHTDMRPWTLILRLVAPFLGTGDLARCIAGLGSVSCELVHNRLLSCASILHIDKFEWGSPHKVCSFSSMVSVPVNYHFEHGTRYLHFLPEQSLRLLRSRDIICDLRTLDKFMAAIGGNGCRKFWLEVDWYMAENAEWIAWEVEQYTWADACNYDVAHAYSYAVDRLRECCVERGHGDLCLHPDWRAITIDCLATPLPAWLCAFNKFLCPNGGWSEFNEFAYVLELACIIGLAEILPRDDMRMLFDSQLLSFLNLA